MKTLKNIFTILFLFILGAILIQVILIFSPIKNKYFDKFVFVLVVVAIGFIYQYINRKKEEIDEVLFDGIEMNELRDIRIETKRITLADIQLHLYYNESENKLTCRWMSHKRDKDIREDINWLTFDEIGLIGFNDYLKNRFHQFQLTNNWKSVIEKKSY